jgi:hypothetical protein
MPTLAGRDVAFELAIYLGVWVLGVSANTDIHYYSDVSRLVLGTTK